MKVQFLDRLDQVDGDAWNALAGSNPFVSHQFLQALEESGSVGEDSGWEPRHLALFDDEGLAAAAPLYAKSHSWGEFVFDFAWAQAAHQAGMRWYPKLVCAVPFSPVTGPRLLVRPGLDPLLWRTRLLDVMQAECASGRYSSAAALFIDESSREASAAAGWLVRSACHFRWSNDGYGNFDDFLAQFSSEKRKKAKRDRRRVQEQGIEFVTRMGDELSKAELARVHALHSATFHRHGHEPYLNLRAFSLIAARLPTRFIVKLALLGGHIVGAAVFLRSDDTLYGRYWGADDAYHSLHFEACYYQGIDYCIEHGLQMFEPGTQGEHKVARGFVPYHTWSSHWIEHAGFRQAIAQYLRREARGVNEYAEAVSEHLPFRQ